MADRIAAFVHWNDRESLNVAERVVAAVPERLTLERLDRALGMLDAGYPGGAERLASSPGCNSMMRDEFEASRKPLQNKA